MLYEAQLNSHTFLCGFFVFLFFCSLFFWGGGDRDHYCNTCGPYDLWPTACGPYVQWSMACSAWFMVYGLTDMLMLDAWCAAYDQRSIVCSLSTRHHKTSVCIVFSQRMVHGPWSIVDGRWSMVHGLWSMSLPPCRRFILGVQDTPESNRFLVAMEFVFADVTQS